MPKRWLGVSILIPKNYSEALSNFLFEQGATGIEEIEEFSGNLRLRAYFVQDGSEKKLLRAISKYIKSLKYLDKEISNLEMETVSIPEKDWAADWKRFFKPFQVSSKFIIKPPWAKVKVKEGMIPINILPAMAFGTGTHPSTKLCIKALEELEKIDDLSVLDFGTGSGILAIISAKLGANDVLGIDKDEVAIENARINVKENSVLNIVKIKRASIGNIKRTFDIIVANIDLKTLKRSCNSIIKRVKKNGFVILSGILETEMERLKKFYMRKNRFKLIKSLKDGEWACIVMKKL